VDGTRPSPQEEEKMSGKATIRAHVIGHVQGVWFRGWTQSEARNLALRGWVRNEPDGTVRALLHGAEQNVEAMVALLWRGPSGARVTAVETEVVDPVDIPADFEVVR
jgi:acylphosphatase